MSNIETILKSEFSEKFIILMKNRMVTSFYKYGSLKANFDRKNPEDNCRILPCLEDRLKLYKETGNTEWLIDIANYAMMEFMYPQHPRAHFRATDSDESPGAHGLTIKEIEKLD